ncbi:dolichyl-phosphate-mannose--protein mannosyltransferase [Cryptosporangium sp. NPDC051539]|uniref:dolichyl-phosphate-mannose--protein mannosyltransferase n=1 Tax=Cryptosporangium sp. NPDC051539 TaxID=3363962 RepID=UPI00379C8FAD
MTESLSPSAVEPAPEPGARPSLRYRLASGLPTDQAWSWLWTGLVALLALVLRLVGLGTPGTKIFDEVYYAKEAHDLLQAGVELNKEGDGPGYVVHPPLGKWMIALGEHVYGYNALGWRISAALIGALSVLLLARIARRMFGSTLLGCVAGLLLALDGLHFVMSRVALLDIFLMFFLLLAFGCALLDRDSTRSWLLRRADDGVDLSGGAGTRVPWWRIAMAASAACALGVKWSATWYIVALFGITFWWAVQARRSAGVKRPFVDTLARETGWYVLCGVLLLALYLSTWTGWFLSDDGWNRHGNPWPGPSWLPASIGNLWEYHVHAYEFHTGLHAKHDYQSTPWSWLFLGRPVAYYYSSDGGCGAENCSAEVLALGNPLIWWAFIPALVMTGWRWLARRDWRAGAILLMSLGAGIVPWTFYPTRTMFFFYTLPALPFLVLAVTLGLGMVLGPGALQQTEVVPDRVRLMEPVTDRDRRLVGAVAVAAYLLVVAVTFAYFYPIYTGEQLTYESWHSRMWFDSWI